MTIRQLQILAAVCEANSITKAAETLYMTQPAVSKVVRELSEQCAFVLFEKVNGKLKPTEDTLDLLSDVSELLDQFASVENKFYNGLSVSDVNIGCNMPIGVDLMFDVIKEFERLYPHVRFNIFEDKWATIKQRLYNREVDFAIVTSHDEQYEAQINFEYRFLSDVDFCWVCGLTNPIADEKDVDLLRLSKERLVLPDYAVPESFSTVEPTTLKPSWTTVNVMSTLRAVIDMGFVSYLPAGTVKPYLEAGSLKRLDTTVGNTRHLHFVYLPKHKKKKFFNSYYHILLDLLKKAT